MKNVTINDTNYTGVSEVQLSVTGGGTANFRDVDEITTPSGSINITANGTHNVSAYAQAVVNVASGGEDMLVPLLEGTLSGVVSLPDSVKKIPSNFFQKSKISGIIMPGVTEIGSYAFSECNDLVLTELPSTVTKIGMWAFHGCGNVKITRIPASVKDMGAAFIFYLSGTKELTFEGKPDAITNNALGGVITVNVPWAEGEVANAPWGAQTVNYNYTGA